MIEKVIVVAPTTAVPIKLSGFARSLECITRSVVSFKQMFCAFKLHVDAEVLLQLSFDAGHILDQ